MPYPSPYVRAYSFSDYQVTSPTQPLPAGQVDANLDAIAVALSGLRTFVMTALTEDGNPKGAAPAGGYPATGFSTSLLLKPDEAQWLTTLGFSSYMQGLRSTTTPAALRSNLAAAAQADLDATRAAFGYRNLLINPTFDVNQRGAGVVSANASFPVDRFALRFAGGTAAATRFALTDADRAVFGRHLNWGVQLVVTGGAAATDIAYLSQRITSFRGARALAGRNAALSFWARRTAGAGNVAPFLFQNFGSGGSPSPGVYVPFGQAALTTSWQRFTLTTAVPSAAGKTFGTAGNDNLELAFAASAGSSFNGATANLPPQTVTIQIVGPTLEEGLLTGDTIARPAELEALLCQAFYETSFSGAPGAFGLNSGEGFGISHAPGNFRSFIQFNVVKAITPTVQIFDASGAAGVLSNYTTVWNNGGAPTVGPLAGLKGFYVGHNIASSVETQFGWTATAEP